MPTKAQRKKLTRREQRDLDIEIAFLEGLTRRDPHYIDALQVLGDAYTKRGKFVDGLRVDEQLSKLRPEDPMIFYNLACSYALTRRLEQSATALLRAIDCGYNDFRWLMKDPDLVSLRESSAFSKVRSLLRKNRIKIK